MSTFSASWLDLREPADGAARNADLARQLARQLPRGVPINVTDLGCGTGANLRWLAPRLPAPQRWQMVDHDTTLLQALPGRMTDWARSRGETASLSRDAMAMGGGVTAGWQALDLAASPPAVLATGQAPLTGAHLVTAAALADLVSRRWLEELAHACAVQGAAVLLTLCYDGRCALHPRHPLDSFVRNAVNRHQLGNKGFGDALGPQAAAAITAGFASRGYRVIQARSDWRLGPDQKDLQRALFDGWHRAACELAGSAARPGQRSGNGPETGRYRGPGRAPGPRLDHWLQWRLSRLTRSHVRVGHVDLLAVPPS